MCRADFPVYFLFFGRIRFNFQKISTFFFSILPTLDFFFETNFLIALTPDLMYTSICLVCLLNRKLKYGSIYSLNSSKTDKALPIRLSFKIQYGVKGLQHKIRNKWNNQLMSLVIEFFFSFSATSIQNSLRYAAHTVGWPSSFLVKMIETELK
jgi:hypothetical protein